MYTHIDCRETSLIPCTIWTKSSFPRCRGEYRKETVKLNNINSCFMNYTLHALAFEFDLVFNTKVFITVC